MTDALMWVEIAVDILEGIVVAGAALGLLWNRSKPAAGLGAAAGAIMLVSGVTSVVRTLVAPAGGAALHGFFIVVFSVLMILGYAALIALVVMLSRADASAPPS